METFRSLLTHEVATTSMAEELWSRLGNANTFAYEAWPKAEAKWLQSDSVAITIHINGKKRADIVIGKGMSEDDVKARARREPNIAEKLDGQSVKKVIFVQDKLVNFII